MQGFFDGDALGECVVTCDWICLKGIAVLVGLSAGLLLTVTVDGFFTFVITGLKTIDDVALPIYELIDFLMVVSPLDDLSAFMILLAVAGVDVDVDAVADEEALPDNADLFFAATSALLDRCNRTPLLSFLLSLTSISIDVIVRRRRS